MDNRMTVLEEIVKDIQTALFQRWANAVPESEKNEEDCVSFSVFDECW